MALDLEGIKKRLEMDAPGLWRWFSADTVRALIKEVERLRAALAEVKAEAGAVCPEFETCDHPVCAASYAAWQIADAALKGES